MTRNANRYHAGGVFSPPRTFDVILAVNKTNVNGRIRAMFQQVQPVPADPILGLLDVIRADDRPSKVNLTVGVYQDERGRTPILNSVKRAEARLLEQESTKEYLGMAGRADLGRLIPELLWGGTFAKPAQFATTTLQTPGGSGALRVVADFLHCEAPRTKVWLSQPTWPNHPGIFQAAGLATETYRYATAGATELDFPGLISDLQRVQPGDAVVLHGCCHNPTGVDLSEEQWREIAKLLAQRQALPIVDYAYQGYARGLVEDGAALRVLATTAPELFVCASFSKNFGLYRERAGALVAAGRDAVALENAASRLRLCVRTNYSNPPSHGGSIVATILGDPELRSLWEREVTEMRERISAMRREFSRCLQQLGARRDYGFLARQFGMFSMTGLSPDEVLRLREEFAIYLVGNGRINVAGLTSRNIPIVAQAVVAVESHSLGSRE